MDEVVLAPLLQVRDVVYRIHTEAKNPVARLSEGSAPDQDLMVFDTELEIGHAGFVNTVRQMADANNLPRMRIVQMGIYKYRLELARLHSWQEHRLDGNLHLVPDPVKRTNFDDHYHPSQKIESVVTIRGYNLLGDELRMGLMARLGASQVIAGFTVNKWYQKDWCVDFELVHLPAFIR